MRAPSDAELLGLWELGLGRHPIDRALLLCAWARPDIPAARLAELPLGAVNAALLRLRAACFGTNVAAFVDCKSCHERMALAVSTTELLATAGEGDSRTDLTFDGLRFRVPCSRDLAAVARHDDYDAAALALLERCCLERPKNDAVEFARLLADVETRLEALDPAAEFNLALACQACGHEWTAPFDIGGLLWSEIDARARALIAEIDRLARAYGWSEPEILALSPRRRAAYIDRVNA